MMAEVPHDVLFLVLNYDTLLETALTNYDRNADLVFNSMDAYINPIRGATILKRHGSVNWFKKMINGDKRTWNDVVMDFDPLVRTSVENILIQNNVESVAGLLQHGSRYYPVLTAPLAGKGLTDIVAPDAHVASATSSLKSCHKFHIVGTSGMDDDLLGLLDSTLHPTAVSFVRVVGKGESATGDAYSRFQRGVRSIGVGVPPPFHELYPYGFNDYVASLEFRSFLNIQT